MVAVTMIDCRVRSPIHRTEIALQPPAHLIFTPAMNLTAHGFTSGVRDTLCDCLGDIRLRTTGETRWTRTQISQILTDFRDQSSPHRS